MKYAIATVVFLVSCGTPAVRPWKLRDQCSGGGHAACQTLDERCRAGELDSCREGIAAVEKTDPIRTSRLAWYWCARATLDNAKTEIVSGCSVLARVHDQGIGTRHDAAAAAELYARACNAGDDNPDPCTNAARLTLEAHPGDRVGFQRLLARAFEINAWGSVDEASRLYLAVHDTERAVDVLGRTCRGGRKQSCDRLGTMGRLTQNDVRMYEEAVAREEEERLEREEQRREEEEARREQEAQDREEREQERAARDQQFQNFANTLAQANAPMEKMQRDIAAIQEQAQRNQDASQDRARGRDERPAQQASDSAERASERADESEQRRNERAERKRQCLAGIDACTYGEGVTACRPPTFTNNWTARAGLISRAIPVLHFCQNERDFAACRAKVNEALPDPAELQAWADEASQLHSDYLATAPEFRVGCKSPIGLGTNFKYLNGPAACIQPRSCEKELQRAYQELVDWGQAHECTWNATFYTHRKKLHEDKIRECNQLYGNDD